MNLEKKSTLLQPLIVYTGLPIVLFPFGNYPDRDLIREFISLAVLFILTSVWHAVDLGRHTDTPMSGLQVVLAASGIGLWLLNTLSPVTR